MDFTKEDYDKIATEMRLRSVKDSQFDMATLPLTGEETTVLIQNGANKRLTTEQLAGNLINLAPDALVEVINAGYLYNGNDLPLGDVANKIPANLRKTGVMITFMDDTSTWQTYQYTNSDISQWSNTSNWQAIVFKPTLDSSISSVRTDFEIKEGEISSEVAQASAYATTASNAATNATTTYNAIVEKETSINQTASEISLQASQVTTAVTTVTTNAANAANSATAAANSQAQAATILTEVNTAKASIDLTATQITAQVSDVDTQVQVSLTNANAAAASATNAANSASSASSILETITSKETSINQTASQIQLTASQVTTNATYAGTQATNASNSASTAESYYQQTVSTYTQLTETANGLIVTAAKTAVSEVTIGGRNILNTSALGGTSTTDNFGGTNAVYKTMATTDTWQIKNWNVHTADTYSLNFYAKADSVINLTCSVCGLDSTVNAVGTSWVNIKLENITIPSDNTYLASPYNGLISITVSAACILTLGSMKLEQGTKCTAYTPSPEDIQNNITTAENTAYSNAKDYADGTFVTTTTYTSELSILNDSISAKVSQTDFNSLGTRVSTAESNITALSTSITANVTAIDDLNSRMSTAESKITSDAINLTVKTQVDTSTAAAKSYTDSTASTLQTAVNTAQAAATAAQTDATSALTSISNITSDNILSAAEKPSELARWNQITSEKTSYDSQAALYNITTEVTAYDTAYQTLATYLNGGTTWVSGTPSFYSNLTTNTAITGSDYRSNWQSYYDTRTILLNKITSQAQAIAISTAASDATTKANNAYKAAQTYINSNFVTATLFNQNLSDIQSQIDGSITTWFYSGTPTLSNEPSSEWTTDALKNIHLGDIYYDTDTATQKTKYAYRFALVSGTYEWLLITDTDVTTALANAAAAQDTADHKRRVFVITPVTPYDVGDLWSQGSSGDLMRCQTARASTEVYQLSDWILATKYTDDTTANAAATAASKAQITANTAAANATSALNSLDNIISDNILSSSEKPSQRQAWDTISSEITLYDSQADVYGITRTTYDTAFKVLATYLNAGITYSSGVPSWLSDTNLSVNTTIVGSTYRSNWESYYTARTNLLNSISAKAKTLADAAQSTANSASAAATTAQNTANTAAADATAALSDISNITSDNVLSASEKPDQLALWNQANSEYSTYITEANTYSITTEKNNYTSAFYALADYLNAGNTWASGTPSWLSDLTTNTAIVGTTYRSTWQAYYDARTALLNKVTAQAKQLATDAAKGYTDTAVNNIQVGGTNLARQSAGDFTYTLSDKLNDTATMCEAYWVGNKSSYIVISGDIIYSNLVFTGTGATALIIQGAQDVSSWNGGIGFSILDKVSQGSGSAHFSNVVYHPSILNNNSWDFGFRSDYITGTITFRKLKVEYGNKETSWSPAPEDLVTYTAYDAELTVLNNAITSKVSQSDFNSLGTRVSTAESNITENATAISSKVSTTDYTGATIASLINQSASTVTISAEHINLQGAVSITDFNSSVTASALGGATPTDVSTAINNIQVGNRNYFGFNKSISTNGTLDSSINGVTYTNVNSTDQLRLQNLGFNNVGGAYSISFWIKADSAVTVETDCGDSGSIDINATTDYVFYSYTALNVGYYQTGGLNGFLDFRPYTTGVKIYIKDLVIVQGTKPAMSWFPAIEDVSQDATDKVNNIQVGGTNLLSNGDFHNNSQYVNSVGYTSFKQITSSLPNGFIYGGEFVIPSAWHGFYYNLANIYGSSFVFESGQVYTISCYAKSSVAVQMSYGMEGVSESVVNIVTTWQRFSYQVTGDGSDHAIVFYPLAACTLDITGIQIEIGNKVTAYKYSQIDTNSAIATAATTANWGTINNIPTELGTPSSVGLYLSATSMGYWNGSAFKTYMDNTGNLVCGSPSSTTPGLAWNNSAGTLTISGNIYITGGNAATATSVRDAITSANSYADTAVKNIQVGGTNLARQSAGDFTYTLSDKLNDTATMCEAYWVGNKSSYIVISGDIIYSNLVFTGTGATALIIQGAQDVSSWNGGIGFSILDKVSQGSGSAHFSNVVYHPSILNNNSWDFGFRSDYITGTITFRKLKVEYGNKETSWSPAPEDTTSAINTAQSNAATDATNKANSVIGLNKWILKKYSYSTSAGMIPTFALINNLIPDFTEEKDDALTFSASPDNSLYDNYIGIVTTYLYCNSDYTYTAANIAHDDGGSIYVNGTLVYSNGSGSSSNSVSLPFKKGWNRIDLLWAEEGSGDDFAINHLFSQDSNISKMAAYPNVDTINPYSIAYANSTLSSAKNYTDTAKTSAISTAAADATGKVTALSKAHGGFTYLDSNSIYTGTLTANQVNAVAINAASIATGYLSADRIAANSLDANKIVSYSITATQIATGTITADKIQTNTITSLGAVTAGSFNLGNGKFVVDSGGNLTAVNAVLTTATISGTLSGVTGTFAALEPVGGGGGSLNFSSNYGALTCTDMDFAQQGTISLTGSYYRGLRYYTNNVWCRGSMGISSMNAVSISKTNTAVFFPDGLEHSSFYITVLLQSVVSNGNTYYNIPLYPGKVYTDNTYVLSTGGGCTVGDLAGLTINTIMFNNSAASVYYWLSNSFVGQKVDLINCNNSNRIIWSIAGVGNSTIDGGKCVKAINMAGFLTPSRNNSTPSDSSWLIEGYFDNDW